MRKAPILLLASLACAACSDSDENGKTDTTPSDISTPETDVEDTAVETDTQPADTQPADTQPADTQPADTQPADTQPADTAADTSDAEAGCSAATECRDGAVCFAPDAVICGGHCITPPSSCDSDAACQAVDAATICLPLPCSCNGESVCMPACVDEASCAEWEFCAPTGHCVADVCLGGSNCLPNFECVPPDNPHCARKGCTRDDECDAYCVSGACYDTPGDCALPAP